MVGVKVSTSDCRVVLRVAGWEVLYTPQAAEQLATEIVKAAYQVRRNRLFLYPTDAPIGAVNWVTRRG